MQVRISYLEALVGHEEWLPAQEFTDLCVVYLSHVFFPSQDHDPARLDQVFEIMAEHLGGAALERYHAAVKQEEEAEAPAAQQ